MMSFHIEHRPIWLVRAGHCAEVRLDFRSIGKDPCVASRSARLSPLGVQFALALAQFVEDRTAANSVSDSNSNGGAGAFSGDDDAPSETLVMTSTLPRAVETAQYLPPGKRGACICLLRTSVVTIYRAHRVCVLCHQSKSRRSIRSTRASAMA